MTAPWSLARAAMLAALLIPACSDAPEAENNADGNRNEAADGAEPPAGGACSRCAEKLDGAATPLCPWSDDIYDGLVDCQCGACAAECGASCQTGSAPTAACSACASSALSGACKAQYDACQADAPETAAPAASGTGGAEEPPASYAGTWKGTTDDGGPVSFVVGEDNLVTGISIELAINVGQGTCTGTFADAPYLVLASGVLAYDGQLINGGGQVSATVDASFGKHTVTGEYDVSGYAIVCGNSFNFGTGGPAGTFTATRE